MEHDKVENKRQAGKDQLEETMLRMACCATGAIVASGSPVSGQECMVQRNLQKYNITCAGD